MSKAVSWSLADDDFDARDASGRDGQLPGAWRRGRVADGSDQSAGGNESSRESLGDDVHAGFDDLRENVARWLRRERIDVRSLADKLAAVEARLSTRDEASTEKTLARLEARVEQLDRHKDADSGIRAAGSRHGIDPLLRLEGKLNAVLEALASTQAVQHSAVAVSAAQAARDLQPGVSQVRPPLRRRSLGEAVVEIAEHQSTLDAACAGAARAPRRDEAGASVPPRRPYTTAEPSSGSDGFRRDIAAMAAQVHDRTPRAVIAAMESRITDLTRRLDAADPSATDIAIGELRARMQSIDRRLLDIRELAARPPDGNMSMLEQLVRDLGARIEAMQAPGVGWQTFEALQQQIGTLATRLEATEIGLASLPLLDRSLRDLFINMQETRSYADTVASHATEAVRGILDEANIDRFALRDDIDALRALQENADLRTRAMQDALDKVVDRLAVIERSLARVPRDEDMFVAASTQPGPSEAEGGATESLRGPNASNSHERPGSEPSFGQADFIAAARRAAHAAQTVLSGAATPGPPAPATEQTQATRAGLAAKSREYVASHRRPVLMALATLVIIAAAWAFIQPLTLGSTELEIAGTPLDAKGVAYRPAVQAPRALATAAHILGSDPVVTGSLPSLPSRASSSSTQPPAPKPTLPTGLAAAAEAGDAAAQYTLAAAYAEGQTVPRDFVHAARLYEQAADQGIVPARYRLGALYERGLGVVQDRARARSLYLQAADAGSPRAMHNLAVLLAEGDGKPNYQEAATWFRRAAQLGVHDSQFNLAVLLARGLGVDRSLVQSYQWFAIAAEQGDIDAAARRDEVASQLSTSELSVAEALVGAFHPRHPDPAAIDVMPPPAGWDGAAAPVHLNSPRSKIS